MKEIRRILQSYEQMSVACGTLGGLIGLLPFFIPPYPEPGLWAQALVEMLWETVRDAIIGAFTGLVIALIARAYYRRHP